MLHHHRLNWTDSDEFNNVVGYNVYRVSNMYQAMMSGNDQSPPTTINKILLTETTTATDFHSN
jgi:hypothetical protein